TRPGQARGAREREQTSRVASLCLTTSTASEDFMPLSRRSLLATLAAAPFPTLASRPALAAFPDRPIRLIVPFAAGGNADLVGRLLAEYMSPTLGQSLVV